MVSVDTDKIVKGHVAVDMIHVCPADKNRLLYLSEVEIVDHIHCTCHNM